jgi:hypothetical protein
MQQEQNATNITLAADQTAQVEALSINNRLSTSGDLIDLEFKKLNKKATIFKKNKSNLINSRIAEASNETKQNDNDDYDEETSPSKIKKTDNKNNNNNSNSEIESSPTKNTDIVNDTLSENDATKLGESPAQKTSKKQIGTRLSSPRVNDENSTVHKLSKTKSKSKINISKITTEANNISESLNTLVDRTKPTNSSKQKEIRNNNPDVPLKNLSIRLEKIELENDNDDASPSGHYDCYNFYNFL